MVFRAWFALSRGGGLTNSAGEQTHGAYGFLRNLIATIREYSPTHIVVTFDTRAPTFRDELFDEYKGASPADRSGATQTDSDGRECLGRDENSGFSPSTASRLTMWSEPSSRKLSPPGSDR